MPSRPLPWKPIALVTTGTTILLSLLLLPACCCVKAPLTPISAPQETQSPAIGTVDFPLPDAARAKEPTQAEMHNVDFRVEETITLNIHQLRGVMVAKKPGDPVNFDNKRDFIMKVDTAHIGMKTPSLDSLMNGYVFAYQGAPLRNLHITFDGKQMVQQGIIHKIVDIPFTMWADVSADHGDIRIHPTKIDICGINGLGLLKAVGQNLEKMIGNELPHDKGVSADKNDLLLDPNKMLPPPQVELQLVGVQVENNELLQIYDAGLHLPSLHPPKPDEKNTMYYRGGTLRMGKLLMIDADMQVIDTDPSDPFDFYIDRYNEQLVQGFSRNETNYGLVVYMRDFSDLGAPARPGERLVR